MALSTLAPDLLVAETYADGIPHDIFDHLREHDPVYGQPNPINGGTAWSLTRHADIRTVGASPEIFSTTRGVQYPGPDNYTRPDNIMWQEPARHAHLRGFAALAFSPRVVARFSDWIRDICVTILDDVQARGRIDAVPSIAAELPAQVIARIIGVPDHDRPRIIALVNEIFGRLDPEIGIERATAAPNRIREYAKELGELKRREPGVDMTTELLHATQNGVPLTANEFTEMVMMLVSAGFETTHTLIAQGLLLMARDPEVRRQVEAAPDDKLADVIEEMLRIVSPIMQMMRTANEDVEMHGKTIRKGDRVLMWYCAGNRDPRAFEDPHRFDGSRGKRNHQAFGVGPHFCLGNHLARLEAEILFDEMRKRGVRLELDGAPVRAPGLFVNALRKMPMRVA